MDDVKETIRVGFLNRCPGDFWSIEELFRNIAESLPPAVIHRQIYAPYAGAKVRSLLGNLLWARSIRGYDVVHITGDVHYLVMGVRRSPVILTIHDLRFMENQRGIRRYLLWLLWLYLPIKLARQVTVISEFTKSCLLSTVRMDANKIKVIPDCVGSEFVARAKEQLSQSPIILHVGTTPNKNIGRLTAACAGLDVELWILGRLTIEQTNDLADKRIQFKEYVGLTREQVVGLYQRCDIVSFVSLYEGFGLPILEAQATGRPVLTSNISPMSDVSGDGAYHVDPLSIQSIRGGICALLSDATLRRDLVAKGFHNVQKYSASAVAAQYYTLYQYLLTSSV